MRLRRLIVTLSVATLIGTLVVPTQATTNRQEEGAWLAPSTFSQSFLESSYWNTPLPRKAPIAKTSSQIISWLESDNTFDHIRLPSTSSSGKWGRPIYWSDSGDKAYDVQATRYQLPTQMESLRIPTGIEPDPTSDAAMTVYDMESRYVCGLHRASYDSESDTWSAGGGDCYSLDSNGLHGSLPQSDHSTNSGHRGISSSIVGVRWDEYEAREINHVLELFVHTTKCQHVFPMVGDECGTDAEHAPPEGTRIRIKGSINLLELRLSPAALMIARTLKKYGAVIGDQSGGAATLKVENTVAQGRGHLWDGVLSVDSLEAIPFDSFEVIRLGYGS